MDILTSEKLKSRDIKPKRFVHVQSVLPQEDVIALKERSGESSIKEAIAMAVYHYLKCDKYLE